MRFLTAILSFLGLFLLWKIDYNLVLGFLAAILNWNFRLLDSDFFAGLMLAKH